MRSYSMRRLKTTFVLIVILATSACGDDDGPTTDAGTTVDSGPPGAECGGLLGLACDAGEWCDFTPDDCGNGDATGTCRARPASCGPDTTPVCGCDGVAYSNPCL